MFTSPVWGPYWVKREKRGKWHLAESWVAGDAVTYCGKRMRDGQTPDGVLITLALTPRYETSCAVCRDMYLPYHGEYES